MRVAMIGATGLVGRSLWPLLQQSGDLLVLGRRPSGAAREKLGPMESWPDLLDGERLDVAISTLGSTRKKAGSWERFAAVDHHAVLAFAAAARRAGARHFVAVSSVGADSDARNRYLRLKGEVERDLGRVGFERLDIVRPGLLLGERIDDPRTVEGLAIRFSPLVGRLLPRALDRYRPIEAVTVAAALASLAQASGSGTIVHHNSDVRRISRA